VSALNPVKVPALVHRRKLVNIVWCFGVERTATSYATIIFSMQLILQNDRDIAEAIAGDVL
jgi:hypothetical protein